MSRRVRDPGRRNGTTGADMVARDDVVLMEFRWTARLGRCAGEEPRDAAVAWPGALRSARRDNRCRTGKAALPAGLPADGAGQAGGGRHVDRPDLGRPATQTGTQPAGDLCDSA